MMNEKQKNPVIQENGLQGLIYTVRGLKVKDIDDFELITWLVIE